MIDKTVLDNGLTIYTYVDKRKHTNAFEFVTKVGGFDKDFIYKNQEYHFQDGIAHILEHYLVEENDCGNFLNKLGNMQMNTNASTGTRMTDFYFSCVENLTEGINTILNGIYNVTFTEEKLKHLKNPIYQEIRSRSDSKFYQLDIEKSNNLFHNYTYLSVGGSLEEVHDTTIDDLKIYYEAFYKPSNQFIVVAGNFDKNEIINCVKEFYKDYTFEKDEISFINIDEDNSVAKDKSIISFPTGKDRVCISYKIKIPDLSPTELLDYDFYLSCFLDDFFGVTSKLYRELVDNSIINSYIACGKKYVYDYLILEFSAFTDKEDEFIDKIKYQINHLEEFNKELFELSKKSCILELIMRDENIYRMIMPFIDNIVRFNYVHVDEVNDIKKLKFEDYVDTIKNIDFSNNCVTILLDK